MLSRDEYEAVLSRCQELPAAIGNYFVNDYVMNLLLTVVDYQMRTKAVENAMAYYKTHRWGEIRTFEDLKRWLSRYPNDQEGNTAAAQHLFGYDLWTRVSQLRGLLAYFEAQGVTSQAKLKNWAETSDFRHDFEGHVRGLGPAIYNWLVMRQGVDTVKPDARLRAFLNSTIGRETPEISDTQLVDILTRIAKELGLTAIELDWRIWEHQGKQ